MSRQLSDQNQGIGRHVEEKLRLTTALTSRDREIEVQKEQHNTAMDRLRESQRQNDIEATKRGKRAERDMDYKV